MKICITAHSSPQRHGGTAVHMLTLTVNNRHQNRSCKLLWAYYVPGITLLKPHHKPLREELLCSLNKWENWGSETLFSLKHQPLNPGINHDGEEYIKRNIFMCITQSLCCTAQINTTLQINETSQGKSSSLSDRGDSERWLALYLIILHTTAQSHACNICLKWHFVIIIILNLCHLSYCRPL